MGHIAEEKGCYGDGDDKSFLGNLREIRNIGLQYILIIVQTGGA